MSFKKKIIGEGITFDDVLLIPSFSNINPSKICLKTKLTKNITLNIPILSASMDTVTESLLATSIAKEGGIGIIHKNMSIKKQAKKIKEVKRSENGIVYDPITLSINSKIKDAFILMKKYKISGLPVINKKKILMGIITNRDIKYRTDLDTPIDKIMTKKNIITSNKKTNLEEAKIILLKNKIEKLPLVDNNKKLVGLITIKDIDNIIKHPYACKDKKGQLRVGGAIGIQKDSIDRVQALINSGVDIISIDSAHGHSLDVINMIKKIKNFFPKLPIIGGNIVTTKGAKDIIKAGADVVKVGIGPGSICTTRIIAGVGIPQLTAINNVYKYAKKKKISVIADGGIKFSGDIVKAIAAGANCVMIGSLLAGTDEAPGEEIIYQGRKFKTYIGMGSISAMNKGSKDRYFQYKNKKLVPEGIEAKVPYKGKVKDVIYQLCGGIKSGMGYCGTKNIKELIKKGKFIKITNSGLKESHTHNVSITKEAPNYYN